MRITAAVLALFLGGCVSGGIEPAPPVTQVLSQTSTLEGSGTIGPVLVGGFPVTYPVNWSGRGTLTIQYPASPHVIVDGDLVVTPIPPYVEATKAAVAAGRMRFLRAGMPAAMVEAGTNDTENK